MEILQEINTIRKIVLTHKLAGKSIALVPTMGSLHQGHLSLVHIAKQKADIVIVSIFVNPMQFNEGEDFAQYPRTLSNDLEQLQSLDVDIVFTPNESNIFATEITKSTKVIVPILSEILCGKSRPPFFIGIASIITKLFNIIPADIAIFGQKDYQQLLVIRQLVNDLNFPIKILSGKIVREKDGLAMSSRNSYLTDKQRIIAPNLYKILQTIKNKFNNINKAIIIQDAIDVLNKLGFKVDYLQILDKNLTNIDKPYIIVAAVILGKTRLIDNLKL